MLIGSLQSQHVITTPVAHAAEHPAGRGAFFRQIDDSVVGPPIGLEVEVKNAASQPDVFDLCGREARRVDDFDGGRDFFPADLRQGWRAVSRCGVSGFPKRPAVFRIQGQEASPGQDDSVPGEDRRGDRERFALVVAEAAA